MNLKDLTIDKSWTLFLDRDGVINRRIIGGYVTRWEEFEFLPGVPEALHSLSAMFGRIIIVSNQQGIGKGLMTEQDLEKVHGRMKEEIVKSGGRIDAIYHCPFLHSSRSVMRKPAVGMALRARKAFPEIRFPNSLMAGDSLSDMVFGKRLGMKTVFLTDDITEARRNPRIVDFVVNDLPALAEILTR